MTGLLDKRGRSSLPELQRAAQAWCSRLQTAAVSEGLVSVGAAAVISILLYLRDREGRSINVQVCCRREVFKFGRHKASTSHARGDDVDFTPVSYARQTSLLFERSATAICTSFR